MGRAAAGSRNCRHQGGKRHEGAESGGVGAYRRQAGGRFTGTGSYEYDGYQFQGDAGGVVDGDEVSFDLAGIYGGYTVTLSGAGDLQNDGDVEGVCAFFELEGELDMER